MYIADSMNNRIRLVNTAGIITTFLGTGVWASGPNVDGTLVKSAHISNPRAVTVDTQANVYICDGNNYVIYRIENGTGVVSILAGNGISGSTGDGGLATSALFSNLRSVAVDSSDGTVYIGDSARVREVISVPATHAPTRQPTAWQSYKVCMLFCALYYESFMSQP